jgi:Flp pilus assembly CpaF family ATPase
MIGDGSVFVYGAKAAKTNTVLQESFRDRLVRLVAAYFGAEIHAQAPDLSLAPLPLFESLWRVTAFVPPLSPEIAVTFRRLQSGPIPLASWIESGRLAEDGAELLLAALKSRRGLLLHGQQRSGKTTLASSLLHAFLEAEPLSPITVIEDTPEILLPPGTSVFYLRVTAERDLGHLVTASLRSGAQIVLLGEVRDDGAARALLNALHSGHGGLTTFHAATPADALYRLMLLAGASRLSTVAQALPLSVSLEETRVSAITELTPLGDQVRFTRLYGDEP